MRTVEEINELTFLAQEAIALGATKYPTLTLHGGKLLTQEWLGREDNINPYGIVNTVSEQNEGAEFEQGVMKALQENGHCIPTYEVGIDPDFLAYVLEQDEQ